MKEKILKLRAEGLSYGQIKKELGCSKGTISFHCGVGQKEKYNQRLRKRRKENVIQTKVENFIYKKPRGNPRPETIKRKPKSSLRDKVDGFQRRIEGGKMATRKISKTPFNYKDVIEKFGEETICYLTGRKINLNEPRTYHFDHIIPASKNGNNSIDNLGIACNAANIAKANLPLEDFLSLCKEILEHNGYKVVNNKD